MINYVIRGTNLTTRHLVASNDYSGMIDWPSYNESLVRRGQVLLDFDVLDGWDHELSKKISSYGKRDLPKSSMYNMFNRMSD